MVSCLLKDFTEGKQPEEALARGKKITRMEKGKNRLVERDERHIVQVFPHKPSVTGSNPVAVTHNPRMGVFSCPGATPHLTYSHLKQPQITPIESLAWQKNSLFLRFFHYQLSVKVL